MGPLTEIPRTGKSSGAAGRLVSASGWGARRLQGAIADRHGVSFVCVWGDHNISSKIDYGDGCANL